jgi:hypothetical protein
MTYARSIVFSVVCFCSAFSVQAAPIIDLSPNISPTDVQFGPGAPNFTSPSYAAYAAHALMGLRTGALSVGGDQALDPTAFNVIGGIIRNTVGAITLRPGDMVASEFASVRITDSVAFSLADVTFSGTYDPSLGVPPGCCSATLDFIIPPGSDRFVGVYWGADGALGGGDDIVYDSSNPLLNPASALNEIFFVGVGDFAVATSIPGVTDQQQFDDWANFVASFGDSGLPFSYSYSLRGVSSTVNVSLVPEPGSLLLLGVSLLTVSRRRYSRAFKAS